MDMEALEEAEGVSGDDLEDQAPCGPREKAGSCDFADALEGDEAADGGADAAEAEDDSAAAARAGATAAPGGAVGDGAAFERAAEAPRLMLSGPAAWRVDILEQVAARDRLTSGVGELYEQYTECLRGLQLMRGSAASTYFQDASWGSGIGPCPSPGNGGGSPVLGPRTGVAGLEDFELPRPAVEAASHTSAAQEVNRRLRHGLRMKEQELEALQQLLGEREEELREKEQAHTVVCRQATLLSRENAELKAQLERMQEQLQAKTSEADRLLVELQYLREVELVRQQGGVDRSGVEVPALPMAQHVFRKVHGAELTCIAAAGMQKAPLPRTLVAIGTADGYVKLLDGETARLHAHLSVSRDLPRLVAVDLSPGTGLLLAASSDHALRLLDLGAQRLLHTLRGHLGSLRACGFLRGGAQAFTASTDRTVKLWDLERGQTLRSIPASGAVTGAGAHLGSGIIVAGHADGGIAVWDPRTSDALSLPMPGHCGRSVVGLCVSPDGRSVLSQAEDGLVYSMALDTMRTLLTLEGLGPVSGPSPPAFSPDGAHILARSTDSICCWSARSGDRVCMHETPAPMCVCWDLPQAVSAHQNGHAALWGSSSEAS